MLLTFSEVHDGGDFAACGPWTIATKIYPFYMVRVAAKRANPLAFIQLFVRPVVLYNAST